MILSDLPISSSPIEAVINRSPLTVSPEALLREAIELMTRKSVDLSNPIFQHQKENSSCVLVIEQKKLVGLITERDIVKLTARQMNLEGITVAEVMTRNLITLQESEIKDTLTILSLLRSHRIRHLPVVTTENKLVGLIDHYNIRQALQPFDLLRVKQVADVMTTSVIYISPDASLRDVVNLMNERGISCVVIAKQTREGICQPAGIVTERDIVKFQSLELDLDELKAETVMSYPLYCINPQDSLWAASQAMEQRRVRHLIVRGNSGELIGIVTQTTLLRAVDPMELHKLIQILKQRVNQLQNQTVQLLEERNVELEKQVGDRTAEIEERTKREREANQRESLISKMALRVRCSLNIKEILNTTVSEVRQLLKADRAIVYKFKSDWSGGIVVESVKEGFPKMQGIKIYDHCFANDWVEVYRNGHIQATTDIDRAGLSQCHVDILSPFEIKANLVLPILQGEKLWGLLGVHQCSATREWEQEEIEFLEKLSTQVGIAIQQAELHQEAINELKQRQKAEAEIRQLNAELEKRVKERTLQLESTNRELQKEISDRNLLQNKLQQSEAKMRAILEAMTDTILVLTPHEESIKVVPTNAASLYREGMDPVGKIIEEFFKSSQLREIAVCKVKQALEQKQTVNLEYSLSLGDSQVWFAASISPMAEDSVIWVARDITSRKKAEGKVQQVNQQLAAKIAELEQRHGEMNLLYEMSQFLQGCSQLSEAYEAIAGLIQPLFPNSCGAIFLTDDGKKSIKPIAMWGENMNSETRLPIRYADPAGRDKLKDLQQKNCHATKNVDVDVLCKHIPPSPHAAQSLCVPMLSEGKALGILYLGWQELGQLNSTKEKLAAIVAEQISSAIANLKLRETLKQQTIRDPLTNLFNRRYLEESLEREIDRARRQKQTLGIIMVDIDHFKRFNDTFGHQAGDEVLRRVGQFLQKNIRHSDIACRYGGEEMTLMLPGASLKNTWQRAEQMRQGIKRLNLEYEGESLGNISVSIGVACFPQHGRDQKGILQAADEALYIAKEKGRNRVIAAD